ncbi:MAG: mucin desulfatase [Lentisphaerae bacterium GWF2_45_14]|nr:MAG: mucin desulfatase [Lentisphaerae bacterium GWF2_45_14]
MKNSIIEIGEKFNVSGELVEIETFESGHINDTFVLKYMNSPQIRSCTLQRINHEIFKNPPAVMENISRVTEHLHSKQGNDSRSALTVIKTRDGKDFHLDAKGNYWRMYVFIENARSYEFINNPDHVYQAAHSYGSFQKHLADLPGNRLNETIPDFHNTPKRLEALERAIESDVHNRAASAMPEIDFALSHKKMASTLIELCKHGEIPERITHNDTKLNNVLIDDKTGKGICVIDLDTVMPGLSLYDFGDLVRTATCPAAEDETDLSKIKMDMTLFEALCKGYLDALRGTLTAREIEYLPFSGKLITLEIGVRFLTDYLMGDVYFKTRRYPHNLERSRTQFTLVKSIESQEDAMNSLVKKLASDS